MLEHLYPLPEPLALVTVSQSYWVVFILENLEN